MYARAYIAVPGPSPAHGSNCSWALVRFIAPWHSAGTFPPQKGHSWPKVQGLLEQPAAFWSAPFTAMHFFLATHFRITAFRKRSSSVS